MPFEIADVVLPYLGAMRNSLVFPACCLAFAGGTFFLGYCVQRTDFHAFISAFGCLFGLYAWVVFFQQNPLFAARTRHLLWLGIGARALLLFSIPNLSDDYARFLWDGRLSAAGICPFAHIPSYFIENQSFPPGITTELYEKLNSPHYYTVYPPVCQAVFALAAWIFPSQDLGGVLLIKLFLLACEAGTIRLLWRWDGLRQGSLPGGAALAYALNPLPIVEISGNCHFEGALIFFLLAGIFALRQGRLAGAALCWAFATASKLLPVLFLPIVWRWLGWRKGLVFNAIFAFACLAIFAPLLAVLPNMLESIDLYFRQFQFNASIYYLVRALGFWAVGWDIGEISGPWLGGVTALGVVALAWRLVKTSNSVENLCGSLLFALFLYLSLSATVQPWYLTVPLALSLLTRWKFMIAWSGLVALSYSHYRGGGMQEDFRLIAWEYGLLWMFFLWELRRIIVRGPP